jgi:hypothetical protein
MSLGFAKLWAETQSTCTEMQYQILNSHRNRRRTTPHAPVARIVVGGCFPNPSSPKRNNVLLQYEWWSRDGTAASTELKRMVHTIPYELHLTLSSPPAHAPCTHSSPLSAKMADNICSLSNKYRPLYWFFRCVLLGLLYKTGLYRHEAAPFI